jgi:hypothetical protein
MYNICTLTTMTRIKQITRIRLTRELGWNILDVVTFS